DDEHVRSGLRHDDPQVDHGRRLAFARCGARDQDRLQGKIDTAEADVRAKRAVGFREVAVERAIAEDQLVRLGYGHALSPFAARSVRALARGMIPMTGAPMSSSASSGCRTELSRYSSVRMMPSPITSARPP